MTPASDHPSDRGTDNTSDPLETPPGHLPDRENLSRNLVRRLTRGGTTPSPWLDTLPALLADVATRWGLVLRPPFPGLSYNYVAPARRTDGTEVVLKIGPLDPERQAEAIALTCWGGAGCVRLLAQDKTTGALLLARVAPGTELANALHEGPLTDDDATAALGQAATLLPDVDAGVARAEAQRQELPLPDILDWGTTLDLYQQRFGNRGPLERRRFEQARVVLDGLRGDVEGFRLLHGDLHHHNVLADRDTWIVIDPKSVLGPRELELAASFGNPLQSLAGGQLTQRRLARRSDILSEISGFDRARILELAAMFAVISVCWSLESPRADFSYLAPQFRRIAALGELSK